jgi:hypothetical protein
MSESAQAPLQILAERLAAIDEQLTNVELQRTIGEGLVRELSAAIVGFRQRHVGVWPSPQAELF